jgi:hypothetical protein
MVLFPDEDYDTTDEYLGVGWALSPSFEGHRVARRLRLPVTSKRPGATRRTGGRELATLETKRIDDGRTVSHARRRL